MQCKQLYLGDFKTLFTTLGKIDSWLWNLDEFGNINKCNLHCEGCINPKFETLFPVTLALKSLLHLNDSGILLFASLVKSTLSLEFMTPIFFFWANFIQSFHEELRENGSALANVTLVSVAYLSPSTGLVLCNGQCTERITWAFSLFLQVPTLSLLKNNTLNSSHLKVLLKFALIMCDAQQLESKHDKKWKGHLFGPMNVFCLCQVETSAEQDGGFHP